MGTVRPAHQRVRQPVTTAPCGTSAPDQLVARALAAIKSRGGKIVLMLAGSQPYYKDADGHFSLSKWKERIDRFRKIDFSSYVNDGTLIGHYLIDEPYDPANWNGRPVSGVTLDEMARTASPSGRTFRPSFGPSRYLEWAPYRYLDAAWAQYVCAWATPTTTSRRMSPSAKRGPRSGRRTQCDQGRQSQRDGMTRDRGEDLGLGAAEQPVSLRLHQLAVRDAPVDESMKDAMDVLRNKAQNSPAGRCRAG